MTYTTTESGSGTIRPSWARTPEQREALSRELATAVNRTSAENQSDTPDFILGAYLLSCLEAYENTVRARSQWFEVPAPTERPPAPPLGAGSRFYHPRADLFGAILELLPVQEGDPSTRPEPRARVAYEYPHDGTPQVVPLAELESAAGKG